MFLAHLLQDKNITHTLLIILRQRDIFSQLKSNFVSSICASIYPNMSQGKQNKKFKWALDFNQKNRASDVAVPPGYNQFISSSHTETSKDTDSNLLLIKKLWDVALGPLKQVPMNLFIMYMAGNSISIFPIMMVGMLIVRPVKALFTTQSTFKMVDGTQAVGQKFVYFIGNIVNILLALYKCQSMGLLPTHSSDWLAFEEPQTRVEHIGGGISMI